MTPWPSPCKPGVFSDQRNPMSTDEGSEFREIAHSGGKFELIYDAAEKGVALRFSQSGAFGCALFQLAVALDGSLVAYAPLGGLDSRPPRPRPPIVPIFLASDREQMWGRCCPSCKSYFRTDRPGEILICPYCGKRDANPAFTTGNQTAFIDRIRQAWLEAFTKHKNVLIDMDAVADLCPENRPNWAYSEERQQNRYKCVGCGTSFDVLGEYVLPNLWETQFPSSFRTAHCGRASGICQCREGVQRFT